MGTYERRVLLNNEDLKMKFKKWMRKNLRTLSVVLAWNYLKAQSKSPYPTSMPVGEEVMIDDTPTCGHHMDDQGSWENDPILHPQFIPSLV